MVGITQGMFQLIPLTCKRYFFSRNFGNNFDFDVNNQQGFLTANVDSAAIGQSFVAQSQRKTEIMFDQWNTTRIFQFWQTEFFSGNLVIEITDESNTLQLFIEGMLGRITYFDNGTQVNGGYFTTIEELIDGFIFKIDENKQSSIEFPKNNVYNQSVQFDKSVTFKITFYSYVEEQFTLNFSSDFNGPYSDRFLEGERNWCGDKQNIIPTEYIEIEEQFDITNEPFGVLKIGDPYIIGQPTFQPHTSYHGSIGVPQIGVQIDQITEHFPDELQKFSYIRDFTLTSNTYSEDIELRTPSFGVLTLTTDEDYVLQQPFDIQVFQKQTTNQPYILVDTLTISENIFENEEFDSPSVYNNGKRVQFSFASQAYKQFCLVTSQNQQVLDNYTINIEVVWNVQQGINKLKFMEFYK